MLNMILNCLKTVHVKNESKVCFIAVYIKIIISMRSIVIMCYLSIKLIN